VWNKVVVGWQRHGTGQPGGAASTDFLHHFGLLLLM
jgi:hypothetical protein